MITTTVPGSMELVATPGNPLPEGMWAGSLATSDGVRLRYAVCGEERAPRGTICVFQGRGEFIERYFETVRELRRRGYAVALVDWRGQGGSDRLLRNRLKGHVGSFRQYARDLADFMTGVVLPDCPPPYCALAHSTGGAVLLGVLSTRTWFGRVVMTSPFIALAGMPVPTGAGLLLASLAVGAGLGRMSTPGRDRRPMGPSGFPGNTVTSDEGRYMRDCATLAAAPSLGIGAPTWGWLRAALAATRRLQNALPREGPRVPVLMVAAGADRIVSTEAIRHYARRMPGVSCAVIEGARHEILMERDLYREQFWAAFDAFMGTPPLDRPQPARRDMASA
ncbi:MAG: alpha/beta fold hydrolase [Parvibaculaceae bacterium]